MRTPVLLRCASSSVLMHTPAALCILLLVMHHAVLSPKRREHASSPLLLRARLGLDEFAAVVEMVDVVLDPFPVGGGRSSLEVFAVGTPIVMLYNRTSILQVKLVVPAIKGPVKHTTTSTE